MGCGFWVLGGIAGSVVGCLNPDLQDSRIFWMMKHRGFKPLPQLSSGEKKTYMRFSVEMFASGFQTPPTIVFWREENGSVYEVFC